MIPKRILLAHGDLSAGGGAESYAKAIIRDLRAQGHIVGTLDINGHWPAAGRRRMPWPLALGTGWVTRRFSLWKYALVCRALPRVARGYDQVILSYGEGPALDRPVLQVLHAPQLFTAARPALAVLGARTRGPALYLRQAYARLCTRIARPQMTGPGIATLANAHWTARKAAEWTGLTGAEVLYPEVRPPARPDPLPPRDPHRILALGRIVPNKRLEEAVALVEALRAQGLPARLEILGRADTAYARRLIRRLRGHPHVNITANATPTELALALARARLGYHGYRSEHFGIAVGEMIAAGVIPIVQDAGGVCELVPEADLRVTHRAEAVLAARRIMGLSPRAARRRVAQLQRGAALTQALNFSTCLADRIARHVGPGPRVRHRVPSLHPTPAAAAAPPPDPRLPGFLQAGARPLCPGSGH